MIDKGAFRDLFLTDEQIRLAEEVMTGLVKKPFNPYFTLAVALATELKTVRAAQAALAILLSVEADIPESDNSRKFFSFMKNLRNNVLEKTQRGCKLISQP